jgi:hypothetical protein
MGKDEDIVVVSFKVTDKFPATDLMEFIEKGYSFVLDSDISSGEEQDGTYAVFLELARNKKVPSQIFTIINDAGKLCEIHDWRFRYYKEIASHTASLENLTVAIPLSAESYQEKLRDIKETHVSKFLDKGATNTVNLDINDNLTISKPYAESLSLKLVDIGKYSVIKESVTGATQLDSKSISQTIYLTKYLGNYSIEKIGNEFMIINGDQAMLVSGKDW